MTLAEWGKRKAELRSQRKAAYKAGDLARWRQADDEIEAHDLLRPAIEAETRRIREANRNRDAWLKAKGDWAAMEARERERAAMERLMTRRTGVNVGAP